MLYVIVAPFSPKWNNIASVRWERLSRYLSRSNRVILVTSKFPGQDSYRPFDIGTAILVEVPLKAFKRNLNTASAITGTTAGKLRSHLLARVGGKLKSELRPLLELMFPISSGGVLLHDFRSYVTKIKEIIEDNLPKEKIVLVTSYGPWFSLKIGQYFKDRFAKDILWIADFTDPSFRMPECRVSNLPLFKKATKRILTNADAVLVVSKGVLEDYYRPLCGSKVYLLPMGCENSFSEKELLMRISDNEQRSENSLIIAYTGSLQPKSAKITPFVRALKLLKTQSSIDIKFIYAGKDFLEVHDEFARNGVDSMLINYGLVPRDHAIEIQRKADLLLLIPYTGDDELVGRAVRPGKVYEYLASFKPMLVIAPKSWELRDEIEADGVSKVFDKNEIDQMASFLVRLAKNMPAIDLQRRKQVVERYLYSNLTKELEELVKNLWKGIS